MRKLDHQCQSAYQMSKWRLSVSTSSQSLKTKARHVVICYHFIRLQSKALMPRGIERSWFDTCCSDEFGGHGSKEEAVVASRIQEHVRSIVVTRSWRARRRRIHQWIVTWRRHNTWTFGRFCRIFALKTQPETRIQTNSAVLNRPRRPRLIYNQGDQNWRFPSKMGKFWLG